VPTDGLARERVILNLAVAALAAITLAPFAWLLVMSFKTNAEIFRFPPRLFFEATWANYAALWTSEFRNSFVNAPIALELS